MEKEAHEREQISWACSAQDSKLLPKRTLTKQQASKKIKSMVSPMFEAYRMQQEEQKRKRDSS